MKKVIKLLLASTVLLMILGMVRGEYRHKQVEIEKALDRLDPAQNHEITYLDFLTYRVMKNHSARVATLGSSVTKGSGASSPTLTWRALLQNDIRETSRPLKHVTIANHGHSGYTSSMLLRKDIIKNVINNKPDLLIIETSIINNYRKSETLESTESSLKKLYDTFKNQIPGVEILFISPNPIVKDNLNSTGLNDLGLTYEEYVDFTEQVITANEWNYFDTHQHILDELEARRLRLKDILNDPIHPNDLGYSIWFEKFFKHGLSTPNFGQERI